MVLPSTKRIAESIRDAMTAQGVSEVALVEATGIPRSTLRRRLHAFDSFKVEELERVCAHLALDPADLIAEAAA